jgi:4-hydroxybenzoate polyprenyltransferase
MPVMQPASETKKGERPATLPPLLRLLSCIRFDEVLVLQGSPLLGAVFSMGRLSMESVLSLSMLAIGSCCLVAHVFVLNDWSETITDIRDPYRSNRVFATKGIGRTEIGYLWMALLAMSLLVLSLLGSRTVCIALAIACLSMLYSAPVFHMKGAPLLGSALHLIGGILLFLLGYSIFRPVDTRGLGIGCFFALVFVAGHLTHEARDRDGDLLNGIRTNAVTFGRARGFAAGLLLFTISYILLVVMGARGSVPRALAVVAALYPLHLYWSLRALRQGLSFESIRQLQTRYRLLYAFIGAMMVVTVLIGKVMVELR